MSGRGLLFRLALAHRALFGLLTAVSVFGRLAGLVLGKALQWLFDAVGRGAGSASFVWAIVGIMAAGEAARMLSQFPVGQARTEPRLRHAVTSRLRHNLFVNALAGTARAGTAPPEHAATTTALGTDVENVVELLAWTPTVLGRWVFSVSAVSVMAWTSPTVTGLLLVPLLLVALVSRRANNRLGPARRRLHDAQIAVAGAAADLFACTATVKGAWAQESVIGHIRDLDRERVRAERRENLLQAARTALPGNAGLLANGILLMVTAEPLSRGTFSVGDLTMFVFYGLMLADTFSGLGVFSARRQRSELALERMVAITGTPQALLRPVPPTAPPAVPPAVPPTVPPAAPGVRVQDLAACRHGAGRGTSGVTFHAPAGGTTVLCGDVASGKSTVLAVLAGLLEPTGGEVRWDAPAYVMFVPQNPWLFDTTVRENVLLGAQVPESLLAEAVHVCQLEPDLRQLEHGWHTRVGSGGVRLSGGQVQRLGLARALVRSPRVLLLDDVTSALDRITDAAVWRELDGLSSTIVVATHCAGALAVADHVVLLGPQGTLGEGSPATVLTQEQPLSGLLTGESFTAPATPSPAPPAPENRVGISGGARA